MKKQVLLPMLVATLLLGACSSEPDNTADIPDLRAQGNEPFWTITTNHEANNLRYQTPMKIEGEIFAMSAKTITEGWAFESTQGKPMVLTVTKQECQDDMSGWIFEYSAELEIEGATHFGCANPEGVKPEEPDFVQP